MGLDNVKLAYANWAHLPDLGFRLLVFMAMKSMDNGRPPLFWLGREEMAVALGRRMPTEPSPTDFSPRAEADRKARQADLQAVKRALMQLTKVGAAALHEAPVPGRRATYSLNLDGGTRYAARTQRSTPDVPTGYGERTERGTPDVPPERTPVGGPIEDQVDQMPGSISPLVGNSPAEPLDYVKASSILGSLPEFGERYMAQTNQADGYETRVVQAALMIRSERTA